MVGGPKFLRSGWWTFVLMLGIGDGFPLTWTAPAAEPASTPGDVDYLRDIKPIFEQRCWACHGALAQQAKLRLDTAAAMKAGGSTGPAIVAGKPGESLLLERVREQDESLRMPPQGKPLSAPQVALLTRWIERGAPAPAQEQPQPDPRQHWAFQPPRQVEPPRVVLTSTGEKPIPAEWTSNPIDAFLAAEQLRRGVVPVGLAEKPRLLRRVTLDLTGLPPTPAELHAFLQDTSPQAYEKVVDRLLASPQYGERWGRHWMDVWRYSDWYGRRDQSDVRNSYPQIWRWRDWIVSSLNRDQGYDEMLRHMLAGDELAPLDDQALHATGFVVRNFYSLNYNQWMRDMVEHTGKAFLGLTLNCAHCHDHKYDPISQVDYFRFRAFFEPLELRHDRVRGEPDPGPFKPYVYPTSTVAIKSGAVRVMDQNLNAETFMYQLGDERNRLANRPPVPPGVPAQLAGSQVPGIAPVSLPPEAYYPGLKSHIREAELETARQRLAAAQTALQQAEVQLEQARVACTEIEQQVQLLEAAGTKPAEPGKANATEPRDPKLRDKLAQCTIAREAAELAVRLARAQGKTAAAQLTSLQTKMAADDVKYRQQPGDFDALARAASRAECELALCRAEEKLLSSEQALSQARSKLPRPPTAADASKKPPSPTATPAVDPKLLDAVAKAEKLLQQNQTACETARQGLNQVSTQYGSLGPIYPATSTGRRSALAQWIASRDNPLTARVAVNHIWMRHFGKPLVESVFDFGRNGKRPTHPELLDWLAVELMQRNWQMKPLHKQIVLSRAYRTDSRTPAPPQPSSLQPSSPRAAASQTTPTPPPSPPASTGAVPGTSSVASGALPADEENVTCWRFPVRQIEAEVVRDSLLFVAQELDLTRGGPELDSRQAATLRRRSLYFAQHPESGGQPEFMSLFDAPDPCDCYRRTASVIPQQALALTNSQMALELSQLLARKLTFSGKPGASVGAGGHAPTASPDEEFVSQLFEQVLSRSPSAAESAACREFLQRPREAPNAALNAAVNEAALLKTRASLVRALLSQHEFLTIR